MSAKKSFAEGVMMSTGAVPSVELFELLPVLKSSDIFLN
jgi:hypothetical protein